MSNGIAIRIPGKPISKKRHRTVRAGGGVRSYSDQRFEEKYFKQMLSSSYRGELLTGPLRIDLLFVFSRPKSHYGTGKNSLILKKSAPEYHVAKPDKDNLEKFALDCMEGIIFKNDSQVYVGKTEKTYFDSHPLGAGTIILIKEEKI